MQTYNFSMATLEQIFARNLRKLRSSRNLTQEEVAEGVGISLTGYQNYEKGRRPKKEILPKIAEYFEVSADELYKDSHNESRPQTFAESLPIDRLVGLLQKKLSSIPPDIYDMAQSFGHDDEVWKLVRKLLKSEQGRASGSLAEKKKNA